MLAQRDSFPAQKNEPDHCDLDLSCLGIGVDFSSLQASRPSSLVMVSLGTWQDRERCEPSGRQRVHHFICRSNLLSSCGTQPPQPRATAPRVEAERPHHPARSPANQNPSHAARISWTGDFWLGITALPSCWVDLPKDRATSASEARFFFDIFLGRMRASSKNCNIAGSITGDH